MVEQSVPCIFIFYNVACNAHQTVRKSNTQVLFDLTWRTNPPKLRSTRTKSSTQLSEGGWAGGRNCLLFMKIMRINYTNVSIVVALLVVSYVFFRLVQRSQLVTADTESVPQTSGTHNVFTCMVHHSLFIFVRRRQLRFRSIILKKNNLANIAAYLISCMGNNAYICIRLKFNTWNTKPNLSIGTVITQLHTLDTQGLLIHVLYSSCVQ